MMYTASFFMIVPFIQLPFFYDCTFISNLSFLCRKKVAKTKTTVKQADSKLSCECLFYLFAELIKVVVLWSVCLRWNYLPLFHSAANSDDQAPVGKAPVQRKTKEAAPKKAPAAKKAAAPKKKAAGI